MQDFHVGCILGNYDFDSHYPYCDYIQNNDEFGYVGLHLNSSIHQVCLYYGSLRYLYDYSLRDCIISNAVLHYPDSMPLYEQRKIVFLNKNYKLANDLLYSTSNPNHVFESPYSDCKDYKLYDDERHHGYHANLMHDSSDSLRANVEHHIECNLLHNANHHVYQSNRYVRVLHIPNVRGSRCSFLHNDVRHSNPTNLTLHDSGSHYPYYDYISSNASSGYVVKHLNSSIHQECLYYELDSLFAVCRNLPLNTFCFLCDL
jgi:hypothetical protein